MAKQAEKELSRITETGGALLTNSGTSALWLLLRDLQQAGPQAVILPAFGYPAAANAATNLGYEIYVADCQADAPVIDPLSVQRLLDEKVAAIVGINYFGHSVDWNAIPRSQDYHVIEDAAGSFGATYRGKHAGANGQSGVFSFHTTKAVAAGGEGGCLLSDSDTVQRATIAARNGLDPVRYYFATTTGLNLLMSDVAACFLVDSMTSAHTLGVQRRQAAALLQEAALEVGIQAPSFNLDDPDRLQNHIVYTVLVDDRDHVVDVMRLNGVEVRPCWPHLLTDHPAFAESITRVDGQLNSARYFADRVVNISVEPSLDVVLFERLQKVFKSLRGCFLSSGGRTE